MGADAGGSWEVGTVTAARTAQGMKREGNQEQQEGEGARLPLGLTIVFV